MHEIEGLNNREIAIAVWISILLVIFLFKKTVREPIASLLKSFFETKVFSMYLLSVGYTCIGISLLYVLHGWTLHELKNAILWCTITLMKTLTNISKIEKDKNYFKDAIRENFKFTIIIEFITETYTFGLLTEFILMPALFLIGGSLAIIPKEDKYTAVKKLFDFLLTVFIIVTIAHSGYEIYHHSKEFVSLEKLREFILSPLLALWFLPWLYLLSVYMRYETTFIMLQFSLQNPRLLKVAKRKALFAFLFNLEGLERWKMALNFYKPETVSDIDDSIAKVKAQQKIEKNPPLVDPAIGWSPYSAKDFLLSKGIQTRYYQNVYEDEWSAASPYTKVDDELLSNNISYYVSGNKSVVNKLELCLTVTHPENEKQALIYFIDAANILCSNATREKLTTSLLKHISKKQNFSCHINSFQILFHKDNFPPPGNQYDLTLTINHFYNQPPLI